MSRPLLAGAQQQAEKQAKAGYLLAVFLFHGLRVGLVGGVEEETGRVAWGGTGEGVGVSVGVIVSVGPGVAVSVEYGVQVGLGVAVNVGVGDWYQRGIGVRVRVGGISGVGVISTSGG